jgi:hypothetical protein
MVLLPAADSAGQRVAKYGADFLAGGVGARALAMGGAHIGLANDVDAVYWNPAGLEGLELTQVSYMHAERFAGIVSFDYGAVAMPITDRSTVAVAFFRSGVNDIKNTLDAWDSERDQPRPDPGQYITSFSAADYAFFVGYGRTLAPRWRVGVTAKLIRRSIGSFASAWGYSFDAGVQYLGDRMTAGVAVQDVSTMLQSWSVSSSRLQNIETVFGDELPSGGTELVLPVVRSGVAWEIPMTTGRIVLAGDADLAFDGQSANAISLGGVSIHPRFGAEYTYRGTVAIRGGLSRIRVTDADGLDLTPTVGAGVRVRQFDVDYGFGDFAGLVSDLGYSHRISLRIGISRAGFTRPAPPEE